MKIHYIKSEIGKSVEPKKLNIKVSFADFCDAEIKHAQTIAEINGGKLTVNRNETNCYIGFFGVLNTDLCDIFFRIEQ
jgi:hypothetical protein